MTNDRQASSIEMVPLRTAAERYDVAILGGGLAGLTLAIQLKRSGPDTSVVVLEKREGPAPLAAFKVGESTVPSGAHYFAEVVGMKDHLRQRHLAKFGLRFFMTGEGNDDITEASRVLGPEYPPQDNFQIDRGLFENELATRARGLGVDVLQGCRVQDVDFGADVHTVTFTQADADTSLKARWVVDAAGRASLLKRKLGLSKEISHTINSAWLRLAGGLDLEQWGAHNVEWMGEDVRARPAPVQHQPPARRGLLGVADPALLRPDQHRHLRRPALPPVRGDRRARRVRGLAAATRAAARRRDRAAAWATSRTSFACEDFAYGVEQAYSTDRWTLVGEAAAFADPFYSPGSDFIGYGNTFTTDLIARDLDGEDIGERADYYNDSLPAHLRAHDLEVRGPVPDDGPPGGDDAQAHLGRLRSTTPPSS